MSRKRQSRPGVCARLPLLLEPKGSGRLPLSALLTRTATPWSWWSPGVPGPARAGTAIPHLSGRGGKVSRLRLLDWVGSSVVSQPGCAYGRHGVNREITMRVPSPMNCGGIAVADVDGRASPDRPNGSAVRWAKETLVSGAPRRSSAARLVVVFVAFVWCAGWAAPAAATSSYRSAGVVPASQVVLGSSFRPIRAGVEKMFASGDYLLSTHPERALSYPTEYGSGRHKRPAWHHDGTRLKLRRRCARASMGFDELSAEF